MAYGYEIEVKNMSQWEVTLRTIKPHIRTDERAFSECEDVDADNVDLHYPLPLVVFLRWAGDYDCVSRLSAQNTCNIFFSWTVKLNT